MKLSELTKIQNTLCVKREGEFNYLGLTGTIYPEGKKVLGYLESQNYIEFIFLNKHISSIICTPEIATSIVDLWKGGICLSADPKQSFFMIHNYLAKNTEFYGKTQKSEIHESSDIHGRAIIADNNVKIGRNCQIEANVVIHEGVTIENNVVIRAGTIVGHNAFYYYKEGGRNSPVISTGTVLLRNNVEVASNCTIAKGVLGGTTSIGEDTKIDVLCHIAHDCIIGSNCIITSGVVTAGSVIIGDNAYIGLGSNIKQFVNIGENAKVSMGAVVTQSVPSGMQVSGNFAIEHEKYLSFLKGIR